MSSHTPPPRPPWLARRVLLALTPARLREAIDGDLWERYGKLARERGRLRARLWYWRQLASLDVVRLWKRPLDGKGPAGEELEHPVGTAAHQSLGISDLLRDARFALRSLRRSPGFTVVTVATLALGIGATTAIFSVVHGVLLRPLPYEDADRLAMVFRTVPRFGFERSTASYPDFADWRDQSPSFETLAAYAYTTATYQGADGAERWVGYRVTAELMPMLGVTPLLGRPFLAEEDQPGAPTAIVLSHRIWQTRFGGDGGILGRAITLDDEPAEVVGVMPADFAFPTAGTEFWLPLRRSRADSERDSNFLSVIGRLAPNETVATAQASVAGLAGRIDAESPDGNEGFGIFVEGRQDFEIGTARRALLIFLGAAALVLLIACANVANLMLQRGLGRRRETAVRKALGASAGRIRAQLLAESGWLGLAGGVLGVVLAGALLRLLVQLDPTAVPRLAEVTLDWVTLGFAALTSMAATLAFAMGPAVVGRRAGIREALHSGGRGTGRGRAGRRLQSWLVVAEVSLAVVLTVGAGLLMNSFARLASVEPGFDPTGVVAARVTVPNPPMSMASGMSMAEMQELRRTVALERSRFFLDLRDRVARVPGVAAVGLAYGLPFGGFTFSRILVPEGMEVPANEEPTIAGNIVDAGYLEAIGLPLVRGRGVEEGDDLDAPLVVLVNEAMAELFWPNDDPIGKRVRIGDGDVPLVTVVGVVANARNRTLDEDVQPMYYRPFGQITWADGMFVVARSLSSEAVLASSIQREVWALNPALPVTDVMRAEELIQESISDPRFRTVLLGVFGTLAVLLALVGVYGVVSSAAAERSHEIGVRLTLGAARGSILWIVLGRGLRLTGVGLVIGIAGAWMLTGFLGTLLYGITPLDLPTFSGAAVLLLATAALASLAPAVRAALTDPKRTLAAD